MKKFKLGSLIVLGIMILPIISISAEILDISHTPLVTGPVRGSDRTPMGRPSDNTPNGKGVAYTVNIDQIAQYTFSKMSTAGKLGNNITAATVGTPTNGDFFSFNTISSAMKISWANLVSAFKYSLGLMNNTLASLGITDAYNKSQVDTALTLKKNVAEFSTYSTHRQADIFALQNKTNAALAGSIPYKNISTALQSKIPVLGSIAYKNMSAANRSNTILAKGFATIQKQYSSNYIQLYQPTSVGTHYGTVTVDKNITTNPVLVFTDTGINLNGAPLLGSGADGTYGWTTNGNTSAYNSCTAGLYGLNWVGGVLNQCVNGVNSPMTLVSSLSALTDTSINTPLLNQFLQWNGTKWVNTTVNYTTGFSSLTGTFSNNTSLVVKFRSISTSRVATNGAVTTNTGKITSLQTKFNNMSTMVSNLRNALATTGIDVTPPVLTMISPVQGGTYTVLGTYANNPNNFNVSNISVSSLTNSLIFRYTANDPEDVSKSFPTLLTYNFNGGASSGNLVSGTPLTVDTVSITPNIPYNWSVTAKNATNMTTTESGTFTWNAPVIGMAPLTNSFGNVTYQTSASVPSSLAFNNVSTGSSRTKTVTVLNNALIEPLTVGTISNANITGTDASKFTIASNACSGATVASLGTCLEGVMFTSGATAGGPYSAQLNIFSNTASSPTVVNLSGSGMEWGGYSDIFVSHFNGSDVLDTGGNGIGIPWTSEVDASSAGNLSSGAYLINAGTNTAYLTKTGLASKTNVRLKTLVTFSGTTGFTANGSGRILDINATAYLEYTCNSSGVISGVRVKWLRGDNTTQTSSTYSYAFDSTPHVLELRLIFSSNTVTSDGSYSVYIDGNNVIPSTSITTFNPSGAIIKAGLITNSSTTGSNTVSFDEVYYGWK